MFSYRPTVQTVSSYWSPFRYGNGLFDAAVQCPFHIKRMAYSFTVL